LNLTKSYATNPKGFVRINGGSPEIKTSLKSRFTRVQVYQTDIVVRNDPSEISHNNPSGAVYAARLYVIAILEDGTLWGLADNEFCLFEREKADRLVERIKNAGEIDLSRWVQLPKKVFPSLSRVDDLEDCNCELRKKL